ncbi:MAG TPA: hypothetical protein DDZ68_12295 [Parvularcula sp.]|nr:hypothetical protein [Parvularcula sp.]HBS30538.1 hypothetical protein [Parvularcula sp.]
MRLDLTVAVIGGALMLAGCTPPPEKSIAKDCVRLNMLSELAGAAGQKEACACFGEKLKSDLSESNLEALAKALRKAKDDGTLDAAAQEAGLGEMTQLSMVGAAKSCAAGS